MTFCEEDKTNWPSYENILPIGDLLKLASYQCSIFTMSFFHVLDFEYLF